MKNNDSTNRLIKWGITLGDFVILNLLFVAFLSWHPLLERWSDTWTFKMGIGLNLALVISEYFFPTIIHKRIVSAGDVIKRTVQLTVSMTVLAYLMLRGIDWKMSSGTLLWPFAPTFFVAIVVVRLIERALLKYYRTRGMNTRTVTFVGDDPDLDNIKTKLAGNPTFGYKEGETYKTVDAFLERVKDDKSLNFGDELYLCVPRHEKEKIRRVSYLCDQKVVHFFYVPVSAEAIGIPMTHEMIDGIEVYATNQTPLEDPLNRAAKRCFDIVGAIMALTLTALLFPFIFVIIKRQSLGPMIFKQKRTGLDGKEFWCYKFRSMHVNKDADRLQATKDDPRKFPFGDLMRKTNIDELPQFWNVLKGDMSLVGPRPHMLAHTEMYSELIEKYMVRHFVKPGITGWAQVTGFRGETKELWQMEERVKRDIWYMENWSFWLDIRICWLTIKQVFVHDKNAY